VLCDFTGAPEGVAFQIGDVEGGYHALHRLLRSLRAITTENVCTLPTGRLPNLAVTADPNRRVTKGRRAGSL